MDLKIGVDTPYPNNDVWSSMRLVRKEGEAVTKPSAPTPETKAAEAQADSVSSSETTPAVAPKKSSGNFVPGPTPRKDFSSEEKSAMLKRARAHAAEVKARKG
jgi:predicted Zn-dependent protease